MSLLSLNFCCFSKSLQGERGESGLPGPVGPPGLPVSDEHDSIKFEKTENYLFLKNVFIRFIKLIKKKEKIYIPNVYETEI